MHLEDAYTFCYELDPRARIIEIYTEEQMDFLTIILSIDNFFNSIDWETVFVSDHETAENYWLGGSDMGHEGEWKWINSGQTIADFVWQTGEQRLSLLNLIKFTTI